MKATPEAIREAIEQAERRGKSVDFPTEEGGTFTVKIVPDDEHHLAEDGDWFGTIQHCDNRRGKRTRPPGFDGAARKFDTRGGNVWWQPPADLKSDPENLLKLAQRVQAYFLEHWSYVGVIVTCQSVACSSCGESKETDASLWAIESDAGEYFAEVVSNLLEEAT